MGGVRRSALISLSDLDDENMRDAKRGQFYLTDPQRSMANNSSVYNEKPGASVLMDEWIALAKSGTGERGDIQSRQFGKNSFLKGGGKFFAGIARHRVLIHALPKILGL